MATATIAKPAAKGGSFLLESPVPGDVFTPADLTDEDRKSTRLNSSHQIISYAVFCLKKKTVVDRSPRFVLPLVHHLVQQRVQRLLPAMPSQLAPTNRDLARFAMPSRVMSTQSPLNHP